MGRSVRRLMTPQYPQWKRISCR